MELNENLFLEWVDDIDVDSFAPYTIVAYELNTATNRMNKRKVASRDSYDAAVELAKIVAERISDVQARNYVRILDNDGDEVDVISGPYNSDINPNIDDLIEDLDNNAEEYSKWKKVDSKDVRDSDGFMTEYTWYVNIPEEDTHIFIFGDSDIYGPDDSYADAEFDSYDLAKEWFDNYYGFDYDEEDPDWVEFAEDRPAIEESAVNETYYAVIEVDGEERKFPFDDRDTARDYIAKAQRGELPEFEDKKIGSTYTEDFNVVSEEIKPNIESEELKELAQKHNIKILDAMENGDLRMEGAGADLMKFYQEAEKLGLWEVDPSLYESNDKVTETLTMHNFDEFKAIADEVGLVTAGDLERFRKEEVQPGESELDAIKRYKQELIDAGVDLSKLVKESLTEGAVKEIAIDIETKEKELADLKGQLDQLKSYDRKECGAGGPYDSTAELDAEIAETESSIEKTEAEIAELKAKVNG